MTLGMAKARNWQDNRQRRGCYETTELRFNDQIHIAASQNFRFSSAMTASAISIDLDRTYASRSFVMARWRSSPMIRGIVRRVRRHRMVDWWRSKESNSHPINTIFAWAQSLLCRFALIGILDFCINCTDISID